MSYTEEDYGWGEREDFKEEKFPGDECPYCKEGKLVTRKNRFELGELFLGCSTFPRCKYTTDYNGERDG